MASHMLQHVLFFLPILLGFCTAQQENFAQCISNHSSKEDTKTSNHIYTPNSISYFNLLQSTQQNPRWLNVTSLRPKFIVTPNTYNEIKETIACAKQQGLQIRVRSGGHDYEGLSYASKTPFVLIDLINLRSITLDMHEETLWVQTGATLGELYYNIAQKSNVHGFPAGLYPSVGVGGHFSGGGLGTMLRKYGLAADNIIDAKFMNARGQILDRESMGEDIFWAIRGGGGASFGVILAWKIKLVRVPPVVTVFTIGKNLDEEGVDLVNKWQRIAPTLPDDLFIRILLLNNNNNNNNNSREQQRKTAHASFNSLYLGKGKELLALMNTSFPELGLHESDCTEMSWINSTLYFSEHQHQPLEVLLNRTLFDDSFKGKSDFLHKPLPKSVYQGINERLVRVQDGTTLMIIDPFGGKMDEIQETEIPFPHRKGNLFNVQYLVKWRVDGESKKHFDWMNEMYEFMEPHVSSSPRAAYFNYRDLDIGSNKLQRNTSYEEAAIWGTKYFKGNFERLAKVKKMVDPDNFFRDQQSIPPIS
ncbi:hypothetical protein C2S51_037419 [Perilla frutescens var. frutescens]|nr:hypothetical protein C2S51_037419 [Perilla frutescens var. frutescens]